MHYSSYIFGSRGNNKIYPLTQSDIMYSDILLTVKRGNLLTKEELEFVKGLSKNKIHVVLEAYKSNLFINNTCSSKQFI